MERLQSAGKKGGAYEAMTWGAGVDPIPNEAAIAADRARWLAELSEALEEARQLVARLGAIDGNREAAELYARIEAVCAKVQALRLRRSTSAGEYLDPKRRKLSPWQNGEGEPA